MALIPRKMYDQIKEILVTKEVLDGTEEIAFAGENGSEKLTVEAIKTFVGGVQGNQLVYAYDSVEDGASLLLPENPTNNQVVTILDLYNLFEDSPLILDANGRKIQGSVETVLCDVSGRIELMYISDNFGWFISRQGAIASVVEETEWLIETIIGGGAASLFDAEVIGGSAASQFAIYVNGGVAYQGVLLNAGGAGSTFNDVVTGGGAAIIYTQTIDGGGAYNGD